MFGIVICALAILGMIICSVIFPVISFKKFKIQTFYLAPLVCALILLITKQLSFGAFISGLTNDSAINPLEILILFLSTTLCSVVLDETGFFSYIASITAQKTKGSQYSLFFSLYFLTSFLTVFTSNDIIVLTFTPFIIFYCQKSKINPIPYLISEFVAANTWSMIFLIGNPTNIYITSYLGIDFLAYLKVMALPTVCAGLVSLSLMFLVFRKQLSKEMTIHSDEHPDITNKTICIFSIIILSICIILMAASSLLNVPMWMVSLIAASVLCLTILFISIKNKTTFSILKNSIKRLPYSIIPFIISMFAIVLFLSSKGITKNIFEALRSYNQSFSYGIISFLSSNLLNNIPMSVLFSSVLSNALETSDIYKAAFATVIGSNIGAFLSPLGALAGIMWIGKLHEAKIDFKYQNFLFYGAIISIPTILISLVILNYI